MPLGGLSHLVKELSGFLPVCRIVDSLSSRRTIASSIEGPVDTVTISPKFQVVIPREIRERLGLEPGQQVRALAYENRIEFIPVRPLKRMRGFLRGIDTAVRRDRDRV